MKIRHKLPKPPRSGRPLYVVGYSSTPPSSSDLQAWFDGHYGGPLALREDQRTSESLLTHGPWSAVLRIPASLSDIEQWKERLGWRHDGVAMLAPTAVPPREVFDVVLHTARLARGMTLLTQGTAYDVITHEYLNPSDWQDRQLDGFIPGDHILVEHAPSPDPKRDWFHTRGLEKFGLDELETFRPVGLPIQPVRECLADIASEILHQGQSPNVGATLAMPGLGLSIRVVGHRTGTHPQHLHILREITWSEGIQGDPVH
jgi:hypothetical protein